jgi:hypothetical protein
MAKAKPKEKPNEGSLERTARLAKKLLAVPKAEADKEERRYQQRRKP